MFLSNVVVIEIVGWLSTILFLISIVVPSRINLHVLGIFTAMTTSIYAYAHSATAIWVKWIIAFFFHAYMIWKLKWKYKRSESVECQFINSGLKSRI